MLNKKQFIVILIIFCLLLFPPQILAANFSGDHKWSWGENIGWLNFQPTHEGVTVTDAGLTGYLWAENVGWIKLDYDGTPGATNTTSTNWGVINDGSGNLAGYAWGENIGWVNFDSTHSQVTITNAGNFSGYAWAENVGWIKFNHTQTYYTPRTSWFFVIGPGMASTSYKIISSDINAGGRDDQTSTTYKMQDTIGGIGTGESASTNYKLKAGYRQMQEVYLSLTVPVSGLTVNQPANMSISVNQVTNATGGAVWNVKTDSPAGYTFSFKVNQDNCLRDESYSPAEYFDDYSEASLGTPDAWLVDSNKYEFGFSVFGNDAPDGTWGTGSSCTSPASNNLLYRGFDSTNNIQVASSSIRTGTSGTDTVLCAAAEQKDVYAPNGTYTANITATAVTQ